LFFFFFIEKNVNTKTIENLEHIINEVDTINEEVNVEYNSKNILYIFLSILINIYIYLYKY
jgi:hypothetical protein